ncbi:uncharacterized protein [Anoplolepis gracilipes]|uniref:uncharacterized protein n=1 Tax=Anoplolepis gracilipes TaxID=354296 RepID=UPI003BA2BDFE
MRFAVALCFLTVLSLTIDANPTSINLDILKLQVRNAKWDVEGIIRQLQLLQNEAQEDINIKVAEKWDEEQNSYRKFKIELLNGIKKEVSAAKLAGKDVDLCYNEAIDGIEGIEDVAHNGATKCNDNAQNSIRSNLGFLDNLISTGNVLLLELDGIFLTCHDSDIYKMQSCIVAELARVKADIRTLTSDANSAELTIVHVSNNVFLQATNCLRNVYTSVYSAGDMIKLRLIQCIELKSEPTTPTPTTTKATTKATPATTKAS